MVNVLHISYIGPVYIGLKYSEDDLANNTKNDTKNKTDNEKLDDDQIILREPAKPES